VSAYDDDPRVEFDLPRGPRAQIRAAHVPDRPVDGSLLWHKLCPGDGIGVSVLEERFGGGAAVSILEGDELVFQPRLREKRYSDLDAALHAVLGDPQ
jgi:hypothetical protein